MAPDRAVGEMDQTHVKVFIFFVCNTLCRHNSLNYATFNFTLKLNYFIRSIDQDTISVTENYE